MTAIVGFPYLDGVLMMADTEETISTSTKSVCDKLGLPDILYQFES